jgi:hypothetical protein
MQTFSRKHSAENLPIRFVKVALYSVCSSTEASLYDGIVLPICKPDFEIVIFKNTILSEWNRTRRRYIKLVSIIVILSVMDLERG